MTTTTETEASAPTTPPPPAAPAPVATPPTSPSLSWLIDPRNLFGAALEFGQAAPNVIGQAVQNAEREPSLTRAAFEQHNVVSSTLRSEVLRERIWPTNQTPLSTDDLIKRLDEDELWGMEEHFIQVRTEGEYDALVRQLDREKANRDMLQGVGLMGNLGLTVLAAGFDLPTLIPAWRLTQGIRLGSPVLSTALQTSVAATGSTALSEVGLQATQELRTAEESLENVAGAAVLGLVLGAGASSIARGDLGRIAERAKDAWVNWARGGPDYGERLVLEAEQAWLALNDQIAERIAAGRKPTKQQITQQSEAFDALEAANNRLALYNDLSMAPTGPAAPLEWARTIGPRIAGQFSTRWLDPIDFIFKRSNSTVAREAVEGMIELPVLLRKNIRGEATALSVTTEQDAWIGAWATFRDGMLGGSIKEEAARKAGLGKSYYAQARQAGFEGNFRDFDRAVDTAIRNGYVDPNGNAGVTLAAQEAKRLLIDPVVKEARAAGIDLPDNPFGAAGYAPRKYKVAEVMGLDGQGAKFKQTAAKYQLERLIEDAKANNEPLTPQKVSGLRRSARNFANESYQSIIRGRVDEENAFQGAFLSGGSPFQARVVPIPDMVLIENGWIEQSVTSLMDLYIRQTVPTLLLAKRFKTTAGKADPSLEHSVIPRIVKEYQELANVAKSARETEAINAEGAQVVSMVRNLRDALMHTDRFNPRTRWHEALNNSIQVAKVYQVTRLMGNMPISQLPDMANIILRQGPGRFAMNIGDAVRRAVKLEGLNGAEVAAEAKRLGAAVEWATNSSMAAMADLTSPLQGVSSPVTRAVHKMARVYSISNFSVHWNDMMRRAVYRTSVDRILEAGERGWANLPDAERTFLAHLGLDAEKIQGIHAAWQAQPEKHDGFLRWATVSDWADTEAARYMAGALNKDSASTIIRPRLGDRALGFSAPMASLVFQFQGFLMSHALRTLTLSGQRIAANGAFSADALSIYTGFGTMIALGWMAEYLYAIAKDAALPDHRKRHVAELERNPGQHLARAIDRSAVTGLFGNGNAIWERVGGVGQTRALQTAFGDPNQKIEEQRSRLPGSDRDPLQGLLGPSVSEVADLIRLGVHVQRNQVEGRPFAKRDATIIRQTLPFQNHLLLRSVFDTAERIIGQDTLGVPSYRYN